jgi:hypothetical protein
MSDSPNIDAAWIRDELARAADAPQTVTIPGSTWAAVLAPARRFICESRASWGPQSAPSIPTTRTRPRESGIPETHRPTDRARPYVNHVPTPQSRRRLRGSHGRGTRLVGARGKRSGHLGPRKAVRIPWRRSQDMARRRRVLLQPWRRRAPGGDESKASVT